MLAVSLPLFICTARYPLTTTSLGDKGKNPPHFQWGDELPLVLCVWLIFLLIIVFIEYLCYTIYMRKDNLIRGRTCVYNVNYHIIWSVKYRRKVLTAEVGVP
jgi:hypothetical protein